MKALCRDLYIKVAISTAYHPQTDGQTEQFNSTLLQLLRCFVRKYHTDWTLHIPALLYAYQNTIHSATGQTPDFLLFGWSPRDLRAALLSPKLDLVTVTSNSDCGSESLSSRKVSFLWKLLKLQ